MARYNVLWMPRSKNSSTIRWPWWRLLRTVAIIVIVLLALPYLIALLYRFVNPVSTLMLWRWAAGQRVERVWTPLERIAPALPLAVIGAEDGTFCHNRGIDLG